MHRWDSWVWFIEASGMGRGVCRAAFRRREEELDLVTVDGCWFVIDSAVGV